VHDFVETKSTDIAHPSTMSLNAEQKRLRRELHKTIGKVSDDIGRRNTFNTAIAAIMELMNHFTKAKMNSDEDVAIMQEGISAITLMLTPIVPHLCHHLWQSLGNEQNVEDATWPTVDEKALVEDEKLIIVQVNGKLRAKITVAADASQADVEPLAFADEHVTKFTEGKTVRKVIYVPGRLLNIVAN